MKRFAIEISIIVEAEDAHAVLDSFDGEIINSDMQKGVKVFEVNVREVEPE